MTYYKCKMSLNTMEGKHSCVCVWVRVYEQATLQQHGQTGNKKKCTKLKERKDKYKILGKKGT